MKYVVTERDVERAESAYNAWCDDNEEIAGVWHCHESPLRSALEFFAQTLGEPVAVPDEMRVPLLFSSPNREAYADGWNACRKAMLSAAPHHPTTEKGCE